MGTGFHPHPAPRSGIVAGIEKQKLGNQPIARVSSRSRAYRQSRAARPIDMEGRDAGFQTDRCRQPRLRASGGLGTGREDYPDRAPRVVKDPQGYGKGLWIFFDENIAPARAAYYPMGLVVDHAHKHATHGGTEEEAAAYKKRIQDYNENFTFEDYPGGWEPSAYLKTWTSTESRHVSCSRARRATNIRRTIPSFSAASSTLSTIGCSISPIMPRRFFPVPLISILDPEKGAADIRAYARRGVKTVQIPTRIIDSGWYEPIYEPIWQAAEETGIVLNIHHNSDQGANRQKGKGRTTLTGARDTDPRKEIMTGPQNLPAITCISNMIFSGVFDRYPKLKLAVSEFKINWVAGLVQNLDYSLQRGSTYDPERNLYKRRPSEYFPDNIFFTFENDRAGILKTSVFGENIFMFAADYPHHVSTWPNSQATLDANCAGMPATLLRKVGRDNANRVFNLGL